MTSPEVTAAVTADLSADLTVALTVGDRRAGSVNRT